MRRQIAQALARFIIRRFDRNDDISLVALLARQSFRALLRQPAAGDDEGRQVGRRRADEFFILRSSGQSSLMAFEQFLHNLPQRTIHQEASAFGHTTSGSDTTTTKVTAGPGSSKAASDMVNEATQELAKSKPVRTGPKVGRNDPCPCGSGKKYKKCHGTAA